MFDDLIVIILAAGDSTRLWPIEDKLFLEFCGVSLIQRSINQLKKIGIKKFVIIANKNNIQNCEKLKNYNTELDLIINIQNNNKGIAGAILSAQKEISNHKILVVSPSDVFEDYLLADFIDIYKENPQAIFVGKLLSGYQPLGYYSEESNIVKGIIEKPSLGSLPSQIAAIVFDYYSEGKKLIEAIKKVSSAKDDLYEKAKVQLVTEGLVIKLLSYNGYWGYLKYPWHVLSIAAFFLSLIKADINKGKIDPSVKIKGPVFIGENVTILENVKIVGPVYIGNGSLIGQNSLIRESIIGNSTVVGFSSEITRSYSGANCWFHHNYIGDSVILNNSAFGFGAVVANYRLDQTSIKSFVQGKKIDTLRTKLGVITGKNSRIGINASLMPGIKIGTNSFVGSGVIVSEDIGDNKFIEYEKKNTRIVDNRVKESVGNFEKNRSSLKY